MTIVVGICVGNSGKFEALCQPAIVSTLGRDCLVLTRRGQKSIHEGYNSILQEVRALDGVSALVLMHDDVEINDPQAREKIEAAVDQRGVAVIGVVGGSNLKSMAWWSGDKSGRTRDRQQGELDFGDPPRQGVDSVDGFIMIFSKDGIAHLNFDPRRFVGFHGYDADICAEARHLGYSVQLLDLAVVHHNNPNAWLGDSIAFHIADWTYRRKWLFHGPVKVGIASLTILALKLVRMIRTGRAWCERRVVAKLRAGNSAGSP